MNDRQFDQFNIELLFVTFKYIYAEDVNTFSMLFVSSSLHTSYGFSTSGEKQHVHHL